MIEALKSIVETFPNSREKKMLKFYLEELKYRFWHYKLGPLCLCTDIDFLEYRPFVDSTGWVHWDDYDRYEIVGCVEIKSELSARNRPRTKLQRTILQETQRRLQVPMWLTTFSDDFSKFLVEPIHNSEKTKVLTETEWMQILTNLKNQG